MLEHVKSPSMFTARKHIFNLISLQMVAEARAGPSQEEEARQASAQELQSLRDSLSLAEAKTKELEGQLEKVNKVKPDDHSICPTLELTFTT